MKWTWNSQFCLVLSQSAGKEQLRLRGTPHLKMSTVITSSAPRQGLANTELSETLVFFPPPSIEVNCSMKFKKKFRMCSITVVKCLLSITWWHREKKVSIVHWVLKKRVQEFKNFTHDAVVLFKKICKRRHMVIQCYLLYIAPTARAWEASQIHGIVLL